MVGYRRLLVRIFGQVSNKPEGLLVIPVWWNERGSWVRPARSI
jgi:hypothetical protein